MLDKSETRITVVGAGIGGLTLALQLHAQGFCNVQVFDSVRDLEPTGVGMNLQPSAVLVYRNLGLLQDIQDISIYCSELSFYNQYGSKIVSEPRGLAAGYEVPQASISRGTLQCMLYQRVLDRLGKGSVHLGCAFESFQQDEFGITAKFRLRKEANKSAPLTVRSSLLVASDGINSKVRSILYPNEGPPRFSGRLLWRGCCERSKFLSGATQVMAGHAKQFFLAYPIADVRYATGKQLVNWVCCLRTQPEDDPNTIPPAKTSWTLEANKDRFLEQFRSWTLPFLDIPNLVESTSTVYEYPMCDRDPISQWSFGRVTMLGDAAHPMYPIGSMGSTQAILDTVALVEHLSQGNDIVTALTSYEQDRLVPTSNIVLANRGKGNNEYVMELVHQRAPKGFVNIEDVVPKMELETISRNYKEMGGADKERVNEMARKSKPLFES